MTGFVIVGGLFLVGGLAALVVGVRHQREERPRYAAMLIGGMMATAFGLILGGFALAYDAAAPLDLNTGAGD